MILLPYYIDVIKTRARHHIFLSALRLFTRKKTLHTICTIFTREEKLRTTDQFCLRCAAESRVVALEAETVTLSIAREMFASSSSSSSSSHLHHQRGTHHRDAKNLKLKFIVMGFVFLVPTVYTIRYQCFEESGNVLLPSFGEDVPNDANAFASNLPVEDDVYGDDFGGEEEKARTKTSSGGEEEEDEDDEKEPIRNRNSNDSLDYNLPKADASMPCGGQPKEMLPFERERRLRRKMLAAMDADDRYLAENEDRKDIYNNVSFSSRAHSNESKTRYYNSRTRRRNLLHRGIGFTMGKAGCGKELYVRVVHENDGPGNIVSKRVFSQEQTLNECLTRDPSLCREKDSLMAAKKLPGVRGLKKLPKVGLSPLLGKGKKFNTCAIVGNAGHLMTKPYGKYIDAHDVVVRFNILPTTGFEKYVGTKTTLRMLNGRRSIALCCRGNFPEGKTGNEDTGVMIWFPAAQGEILSACKKRFPNNPRFALPLKLSKSLAGAMNKLRTDASRLGLTGFTQWRQMTSGAHAILLFSQLCDTINLYGFGSFPGKERAPDQYGGRTARARSGTIWHDWSGEKNVNRLLHAAEVINVCSA